MSTGEASGAGSATSSGGTGTSDKEKDEDPDASNPWVKRPADLECVPVEFEESTEERVKALENPISSTTLSDFFKVRRARGYSARRKPLILGTFLTGLLRETK